MSTQTPADSENNYLNGLSKIIQEIVEKSAGGNYIYRGEPEWYDRISSTLYRRYSKVLDSEPSTLEDIQNFRLKRARDYIPEQEKEDFEILTELQHYGSETNLIDFTTDAHVALYFACYGSHDKNGRVILLEKSPEMIEKYKIKEPRQPQNRVTAQKSIFVQPSEGFIDCDDVITICIPKDLKQWILIHLQKVQDISTQTIYNDLHGYIRQSVLSSSREAIFPFVLAEWILERTPTEDQSAEEPQNQFEEMIKAYTTRIQYSPYEPVLYVEQGRYYFQASEFDHAIETFSKAILLKPNYAYAYTNRGIAYFKKEEYDRAIKDFTKAIDLSPNYAYAYINRAIAYGIQHEYDRAIEDCDRAMQLDPNDSQARQIRDYALSRRSERMVVTMPQLSEKADYLLKQAAVDPQRQVESFDLQQGIIISINGEDIIKEDMTRNGISSNNRETVSAEWELALQELVSTGFLEEKGGDYPLTLFQLTDAGYRIACRDVQ